LVRRTVALGMAAPLGSVIVPRKDVVAWPQACETAKRRAKTHTTKEKKNAEKRSTATSRNQFNSGGIAILSRTGRNGICAVKRSPKCHGRTHALESYPVPTQARQGLNCKHPASTKTDKHPGQKSQSAASLKLGPHPVRWSYKPERGQSQRDRDLMRISARSGKQM
jgi:hypothetical protein